MCVCVLLLFCLFICYCLFDVVVDVLSTFLAVKDILGWFVIIVCVCYIFVCCM